MSIGGKCAQIGVDSCFNYSLPQRSPSSANLRADRICRCHPSAILTGAKVHAVASRESPIWCCVTGFQHNNERGTVLKKHIGIGILISLMSFTSANAAGWGSVHRYVKRSGNCAGQEILASYYSSGKRTATGETFDASGNTAAARTWPLGTTLTVTNPHNGRSVVVRINDTGPWGIAYRMGARLDLARGAAQRLGMRGSQYVCVA